MKAARCDSEISKLPKKVCDVAIFAELGLFERLALAKVHMCSRAFPIQLRLIAGTLRSISQKSTG
jgi:hypothetical protein